MDPGTFSKKISNLMNEKQFSMEPFSSIQGPVNIGWFYLRYFDIQI